MKLRATVITDAKVYYFHFLGDDGVTPLIFGVTIEASNGFISISGLENDWSGFWPDKTRWGTSTFEEFLCARPPAWIASKLLGPAFYEIDFSETRKTLTSTCPDMPKEIDQFMKDLGHMGIVAAQLETEHADLLAGQVTGPLADSVMFRASGAACLLATKVLPCLQDQIRPRSLNLC